MESVDLFVIGAGSGGVRAARIAAGFGAKVVVAEEFRVGGTCVIRGCVPKKLLFHAAGFSAAFRAAAGYGWGLKTPDFSWDALRRNVATEVDRLNGLYIRTLTEAGVEIVEGRARLDGPDIVRVGERAFRAKHILIATGGKPFMPDIPGIEHALSSNEIFGLEQFPRRLVIVGGGYIACEFASIFSSLGAHVTQVIRAPQVLRGFDGDLRERAARALIAHGVSLRAEETVSGIERKGAALEIVLGSGERLETDRILFATGRIPHTEGLGLEAAGVALNADGAIAVDPFSRTSVSHIHAVGDVTGRIALTPVAIKEGHAFAMTVFGGAPAMPEYDAVPSAVFIHPPMATVGPSEEKAAAAGVVDVYEADFRPMKDALGGGKGRSYMKLIADAGSGRVLSVHMIGADAPEIVQGLAIAVKAGLTKTDFDRTLAIHPTAAEEFVLMRTPSRRVGG